MLHDELSCDAARERLSARLDGELGDAAALKGHLSRCGDCRAHERALVTLSQGFAALREPAAPLADLWPRIERRTRIGLPTEETTSRPGMLVLARVAALLIGFVGVGSVALVLEHETAATNERHLFERLAPLGGPSTLFAALPEYRVLRAFPALEESR